MELSDIRHRLCGFSFAQEEGCDMCEPVKAALHIDNIEDYDPVKSTKRAAKLIDRLLDRFETEIQKAGRKAFNPEWAKPQGGKVSKKEWDALLR